MTELDRAHAEYIEDMKNNPPKLKRIEIYSNKEGIKIFEELLKDQLKQFIISDARRYGRTTTKRKFN